MKERVFDMGRIDRAERKELSDAFHSADQEESGIVESLSLMPYAPEGLGKLAGHMPEYLRVVGRNIVMIDDVEGGVARQLAMGEEGAAILNTENRDLFEFDYAKLKRILDSWGYRLGELGIETVSSEDATAFLREVEEVVHPVETV